MISEIELTKAHIKLLKERLKDPHQFGIIKKWEVYLENLLNTTNQEKIMSHINVFVSNQKFCPEIINCEWTDTTDTYVLDSTDYGTRALAKYLEVDTSS